MCTAERSIWERIREYIYPEVQIVVDTNDKWDTKTLCNILYVQNETTYLTLQFYNGIKDNKLWDFRVIFKLYSINNNNNIITPSITTTTTNINNNNKNNINTENINDNNNNSVNVNDNNQNNKESPQKDKKLRTIKFPLKNTNTWKEDTQIDIFENDINSFEDTIQYKNAREEQMVGQNNLQIRQPIGIIYLSNTIFSLDKLNQYKKELQLSISLIGQSQDDIQQNIWIFNEDTNNIVSNELPIKITVQNTNTIKYVIDTYIKKFQQPYVGNRMKQQKDIINQPTLDVVVGQFRGFFSQHKEHINTTTTTTNKNNNNTIKKDSTDVNSVQKYIKSINTNNVEYQNIEYQQLYTQICLQFQEYITASHGYMQLSNILKNEKFFYLSNQCIELGCICKIFTSISQETIYENIYQLTKPLNPYKISCLYGKHIQENELHSCIKNWIPPSRDTIQQYLPPHYIRKPQIESSDIFILQQKPINDTYTLKEQLRILLWQYDIYCQNFYPEKNTNAITFFDIGYLRKAREIEYNVIEMFIQYIQRTKDDEYRPWQQNELSKIFLFYQPMQLRRYSIHKIQSAASQMRTNTKQSISLHTILCSKPLWNRFQTWSLLSWYIYTQLLQCISVTNTVVNIEQSTMYLERALQSLYNYKNNNSTIEYAIKHTLNIYSRLCNIAVTATTTTNNTVDTDITTTNNTVDTDITTTNNTVDTDITTTNNTVDVNNTTNNTVDTNTTTADDAANTNTSTNNTVVNTIHTNISQQGIWWVYEKNEYTITSFEKTFLLHFITKWSDKHYKEMPINKITSNMNKTRSILQKNLWNTYIEQYDIYQIDTNNNNYKTSIILQFKPYESIQQQWNKIFDIQIQSYKQNFINTKQTINIKQNIDKNIIVYTNVLYTTDTIVYKTLETKQYKVLSWYNNEYRIYPSKGSNFNIDNVWYLGNLLLLLPKYTKSQSLYKNINNIIELQYIEPHKYNLIGYLQQDLQDDINKFCVWQPQIAPYFPFIIPSNVLISRVIRFIYSTNETITIQSNNIIEGTQTIHQLYDNKLIQLNRDSNNHYIISNTGYNKEYIFVVTIYYIDSGQKTLEQNFIQNSIILYNCIQPIYILPSIQILHNSYQVYYDIKKFYLLLQPIIYDTINLLQYNNDEHIKMILNFWYPKKISFKYIEILSDSQMIDRYNLKDNDDSTQRQTQLQDKDNDNYIEDSIYYIKDKYNINLIHDRRMQQDSYITKLQALNDDGIKRLGRSFISAKNLQGTDKIAQNDTDETAQNDTDETAQNDTDTSLNRQIQNDIIKDMIYRNRLQYVRYIQGEQLVNPDTNVFPHEWWEDTTISMLVEYTFECGIKDTQIVHGTVVQHDINNFVYRGILNNIENKPLWYLWNGSTYLSAMGVPIRVAMKVQDQDIDMEKKTYTIEIKIQNISQYLCINGTPCEVIIETGKKITQNSAQQEWIKCIEEEYIEIKPNEISKNIFICKVVSNIETIDLNEFHFGIRWLPSPSPIFYLCYNIPLYPQGIDTNYIIQYSMKYTCFTRCFINIGRINTKAKYIFTNTINKIHTTSFESTIPQWYIDPACIECLKSPNEFYTQLMKNVKKSKKRIILSSQYIGEDKLEEELLNTIDYEMRQKSELYTHIIVDYHRSLRKNKLSQELFKISKNPQCSISLHCPSIFTKLRFIEYDMLRKFLPISLSQRQCELYGVHHIKLYIFDDTVIFTGANIQSAYFTTRLDRYVQIRSNEIVNFLITFLQYISLSTRSVFVQSELPNTKESYKFIKERKKNTIPESFYKLKKLPPNDTWNTYKECDKELYNLCTNTKLDEDITTSKDVYTKISLIVQIRYANLRTEEDVIKKLLDYTLNKYKTPITLHLALAYFNPPKWQTKILVELSKKNKINTIKITTPSINTHCWNDATGIISIIPYLYNTIVLSYWKKYNKIFTMYTYIKDGWTYHSKGLFQNLNNYIVTTFGSTNFCKRSNNYDIECGCIITTSDSALKSKLQKEWERSAVYDTAPTVPLKSNYTKRFVAAIIVYFASPFM